MVSASAPAGVSFSASICSRLKYRFRRGSRSSLGSSRPLWAKRQTSVKRRSISPCVSPQRVGGLAPRVDREAPHLEKRTGVEALVHVGAAAAVSPHVLEDRGVVEGEPAELG